MLGVAPLFHITGLVAHLLVAIITASRVTLAYRFEPGVMLEAAAERKPGFTVAAITALMAMMNHPRRPRPSWPASPRSIRGGAPIPPSVVDAFSGKFGHYVHNIYGLTETSSPTHAVPLGAKAPVDPTSGALSVGVPVPGADVWIVERRRPAGAGGRAGRDRHLRPDGGAGLLEQAEGDRRGHARRTASAPAMWPSWTRTAGST